jgi:hypothetical protein
MNLQARLLAALASYALLALAAAFTLSGPIRLAVFVLLAGLAAKTLVAFFQMKR